ncbi:hypothetical protein QC762_104550 [Podospora pseudocomata]|uniref:Major facilitator superfamily transporter protein n=1 Tax=Podospora pseudocomata TaxID=2093779 RepID=A0ABR0GSP5_9PEZI|nr:hypothetical protein QC762_104550 [Podospora pseudocomata]
MGLLSSLNPLRPRGSDLNNNNKLPLYKEVPPKYHKHSFSTSSSRRPIRSPTTTTTAAAATTKERYSDSELSPFSSSSEADDDSDYPTTSPSSSSLDSSRRTSTINMLLPKHGHRKPPRRGPVARPRFLYRLPNKVIRWLCILMMSTIVIFIFGLIRASQLENKRIAEGKTEAIKKPVPAVWEQFDFLTRYYGGVRRLVGLEGNVPEYPRLGEEKGWDGGEGTRTGKGVPESKGFEGYKGGVLPQKGEVEECFLEVGGGKVKVPGVRYLEGRPDGFPDNVLGSYELLALPEDVCFERFGRYGPYGYGYSIKKGGLGVGEHGDREGAGEFRGTGQEVDYRTVDWADAQRRCYEANAKRYKPLVRKEAAPSGFHIGDGIRGAKLAAREAKTPVVESVRPTAAGHNKTATEEEKPPQENPQGDLPRTAVVLRCWDEFQWKEEDILNLRALIAELSLASGGRYDVHLLVQVRNDARNPVWADDEAYRARINETVPKEFRGIATLWSQTQMLAVYQGIVDLFTRGPDLPVHGSYRGLQMAMQHFAYNHPEYEYFWQWEMDIRYTGHYYDLLTKLENWSKTQPRKGLWERNSRFYMPYVHGSWEDFKQMARVQTEHGTVTADNMWDKLPGSIKSPSPPVTKPQTESSVWGPLRPEDPKDWFEHEHDPVPPTSYERDKYTWGVGEEPDLITLSPIFDPEGTSWKLASDITGYNTQRGLPPRRAQIITASRMSRRLLLLMHRETAFKKHHAFPEMWPATVALHHGFKAVYAPHPVFVDRAWPADYLARVLNGGRNGASGGGRTSVYGDKEHNMRGLTWFYNAGFSGNLYRRWMGLKVNNDGGEQFELEVDETGTKDEKTPGGMRGGEGRMCLPPMLLHPVKEVELPVEEHRREEDEVFVEVDPSA